MTASSRATADLLRAARLIPVLTIERAEHAVPLARALVDGGVRVLEVTLRTAAGEAAARAIAAEVPEATVGLGTVLTARDLALVHTLKVAFAFSPGATPELLNAASTLGIPFIPGVATASELMAAMARGFTTVKLFPAEAVGGIKTLRALGGPFPEARFCPTGGIGEDRVADYLALSNVVAVGGSWLVTAADLERLDWPAVTARARSIMERIGSASVTLA